MSCKRIYHLTIAYDPETEEVEYLMESIDESSDSEVMILGSADFAEYFRGTQDTDEDLEKILESFCNGEPGEA
tara:strand:- start:271 stop:489 length:219 start_codon:yes stop_codon:yes gene_type:complete